MNKISVNMLEDQSIMDINNTNKNYSYHKTIYELFEETVEACPENIAIYSKDRSITYRDLNERTNQIARYLRKIDVKPNTIVGVYMSRSEDMLIAIFSILKAGGTYLPIDPCYPIERKKQIIQASQTKFLITDSAHSSESWMDKDYRMIDLKNEPAINQEKTSHLSKTNSPHDIAYIIYTSGSTGTPKGVLIEHHALVNRIEWMQEIFPINKRDILFHKTHPSFDVSLWEILWWSITGAGVVILPPHKEHNVILLAKMIEKYNISVIHFVPSVLRIFLDYVGVDFNLNRLSSLKYVFSSGESLDLHTVQKFNQLFNHTLFPILINLYGPTEATIDVSYFICEKNQVYSEIPIGKPINNIQLYVLDKNLVQLPKNIPGDLYISGIGISPGYLNDSTLTNNAFIPNPHLPGKLMYKTGDIAKWNDKNELVFLGRKDHQVKMRGLRIELDEIDYQLRQHSSVKDASTHCVTNQNGEQYLLSFILSRNLKNHESLEIELSRHLATVLPNYMIPQKFYFLKIFPFKKSGKIDRSKLLELHQSNENSFVK